MVDAKKTGGVPGEEAQVPLQTEYLFSPKAPRIMTLLPTTKGFDTISRNTVDVPGVSLAPQQWAADPRFRYVDLAKDPSLKRSVAATTVEQLVEALLGSITYSRGAVIPMDAYKPWHEFEIESLEKAQKTKDDAEQAINRKLGKRGGEALRELFMKVSS